ncbi:T9SS type A sorting domain-containing protein [Ekhidna sp. MALMAid0563]|uniref:T9SS type A sorting domain-containing protein n=1 Tax=Ekhidna sp. MALMAid0563 TaxID=3143937 RepID=UPI0032DFFCB9
MSKFVFAIFVLAVQLGFTQLTIKPILKPEQSTRARTGATQTVNLPFWDDFSITSDSPDSIRVWGNDTTLQWNYDLSKDVYVNATLAVNPPTYKVATFDGLDANGGFHAGSDIGLADQLVSDTIDLQGRANVVLSFYWQAGGHVEIPEEGDSLILQFYSPNITTNEGWRTVWSKDGGDLESDQDSVFTQVAVEVASTFLTQEFVFRFQSYGDKDGPFDAWHVDWIYLNENRQNDDFYYLDRGLTGQLTSPIAPFKSIPIHQFKLNEAEFTNSQFVQGFNLDEQLQPTEYILVIKDLNNGNRIDSLEYGDKDPLFANPDPLKTSVERFIELSGIDLSTIPNEDSINLLSEVYLESSDDDFLDGTNINLRINDTIRSQYLLHNYYAYDDGTAEYAAGTNISGGQVAIKFWLEQPDTLTYVDIHFPNIDPPSNGSALDLRIFKDLNDEPIQSQNISVINASALNQFTRYKLSRPLVLADTFYLGYQQSKNEYIGVGFDRSSPEASQYIYENRTGQWEQNTRLTGALMIRPVFATVDSLVLTARPEPKLKVYPNPTTGLVSIDGTYESISVIDFSGKKLLSEKAQSLHDFRNLKAGLYLLTIHRKEGDQTIKIIKK